MEAEEKFFQVIYFTCIGFETLEISMMFALIAVKNAFYQKFAESLDKMENWI